MPVRAAAGRAGPFVAIRATEPVSSRMRRGARSGGDRGTSCGDPGGRPVSRAPCAARSPVEESPPQPWFGSAGFPKTAGRRCFGQGLTVLPGVGARKEEAPCAGSC